MNIRQNKKTLINDRCPPLVVYKKASSPDEHDRSPSDKHSEVTDALCCKERSYLSNTSIKNIIYKSIALTC